MIYEGGRPAQIDVVAGRCVVELVRLGVAPTIAHSMDKTLPEQGHPGVERYSSNEPQRLREGAEDTNQERSSGATWGCSGP